MCALELNWQAGQLFDDDDVAFKPREVPCLAGLVGQFQVRIFFAYTWGQDLIAPPAEDVSLIKRERRKKSWK